MHLSERDELNDLRKHQLTAVRALENVDAICQKYNIKYFLIAGSALGAIRHKGFIPWDDDIDIGMCLKDYKVFEKHVNASLDKEFTWLTTNEDVNFPTLLGRIESRGVPLVSVFPIIKISDNRFQRRTQWIIRKVMSPIFQRKVKYKTPKKEKSFGKSLIYIISLILSLFFSQESALKIIRWNEMRYEDKNTEYYINLYSKYSMRKECIRAEWIKNLILVPFEGGMYPVFREYDSYLTHLYGDYMKLPPEHERKPEHI